MAKFKITGPDGKSYEITAPDEASDDDVMSYVQTQLGAPKKELSWADVPGQAAHNFGQSAKNFAYNVTAPIHSPVQTAKGLVNLAAGVGSKIVGAADRVSEAVGGPDLQTPERKAQMDAPLDAVGGFLKDRYGSIEGLKKTLATDPVGVAGDAAMLLYGGGATLPGRVGQAARTAGAVVDPVRIAGKAANLTGKAGGKLAAVAAGQSTGAQSLSFEKAFEGARYGSKTLGPQMRGYGSLDDVAARADSAVGQLVKARSAHYNAWNPLTNMRGTMKPLNMGSVDKAISDASKMGVRGNVVTNQRTAEVVSEIEKVVNQYKQNGWTTAKDLDELKQIVYDIGGSEKQGTRAHKAAMNIYNTIKGEVVNQVPGYEGLMKDYAKSSDLIKQMRTELSLNNKAGAGTKLRKLQSAMRNNATTANGKRTQLVDELSKIDKEIPYSLAGQALNSLAPRGLQGAGALGVMALATQSPMTAAMLPLMSPRLMGEAAYGMGKVARGADNLNKAGLTPQMLARILLTSRAAGAATDQTSE